MNDLLSFIDLSAREFLTAYIAIFTVLLIVALVVKFRIRRGWENGASQDGDLSDDDLALMAGGWPRLVELRVLGLLHHGCARFKRGWFGKTSLVYKSEKEGLSEGQSVILSELEKHGNKGVAMVKLQTLVEKSSYQLEESLAVQGLRAVNSEEVSLRRKLVWMKRVFFIIGAVRLGLGIYRGENIMFVLLVGFIGTLVLGMVAMVNPVTRKGKKLLKLRRSASRNAIKGGVSEAYTAYATLGWLGIAGTTFASDLGDDVTRYFQQSGASVAFDGGSSSGGGDGGDGGCGGCGGCG